MCKIILVVLLFMALPIYASTETVIDFEILSAGGDDGPTYLGTSVYLEDGYTLNTTSEFGFLKMLPPNTTVLFSRYGNDVITLANDKGNVFDFNSIIFYPYIPSGNSIEFIGTFPDNSTITRSFPSYSGESITLEFEDFTDLVSVSWNSSGQYAHFDNIEIVPEPISVFYMLFGALFLRRSFKGH